MRTNQLKWWISLCFLMQISIGYTQQAGLLLIHHRNSSRHILLKKGMKLEMKSISGKRFQGFLEEKADNLIYFRPFRATTFPTTAPTQNSINLFPSISVREIAYLSPERAFIQPLLQIVGVGVGLISGLTILTTRSNCNSSFCAAPDERKGFLIGGTIALGLSTVLILVNRRKRYKVSNGPWVIN